MGVANRVAALALALAAFTGGPGQAADVKIKVGVLNDRSGIYADLGGEGSVEAARMAVEDFKAADKGIMVDIVSADHQNKPDIGANIARQWYDQDGVDVILDVPTSSVALAVSQITREKNKVFIDSGAGAADITGKQCSPNTILWTYDTYALAKGTAGAMVKNGGKSWFFLTADYVFGHSLQKDAAAIVTAAGGTVVDSVNVPFPATDFSSFLLQAQASHADVVGLANAGGDTVNAIKQASEFGLTQGGQKLAGLLVFISDVNALGLEAAQGLNLTEAFYWDLNDGTREWSKRFAARHGGKMPTMVQAGVYAGLLHYLKAVDALKSKDAAAVLAKMKATPTDDPLFGRGSIRVDGRTLHDMYLFQVKTPSESKGPWDYYKLIQTVPAADAFRPLGEGGCPLVKG
ncbi:ABC transporter substrate-binding protein [Lichenifustis flavocetrariae]|uniref:ABC transporter substrate-binding protein n=1 Tax=Lichenifustis flavocetrariae TaxID=2949735 RepID=A0AA41YTL9_9HYPH|nr:ABC transporter substrate-binding protein [Lichenifustis flavocetrariae]MCW6508354.1 ABC transporter substrate-binding protein [Lichenifustis flavocetrariae]